MPRPIALRSAEAGKPPRRPHRGLRKRKSAHTAHGDLEQMRALMQVVLDNMTDGVTLYDANLNWIFSNRRHAELLQYPAEVFRPGITMRDLIRIRVERGEYGPTIDVESTVEELIARLTQPGGCRFDHVALSGRQIVFMLIVV